jgi:hypothetical protein
MTKKTLEKTETYFLGSNKILNTKDQGDFVQVYLEGDSVETLHKDMFEAVKTKNAIDEGEYNQGRQKFLAYQITSLLYDFGAYHADIAKALEYSNWIMEASYLMTVNKLWKKGVNDQKSLRDTEEILGKRNLDFNL